MKMYFKCNKTGKTIIRIARLPEGLCVREFAYRLSQGNWTLLAYEPLPEEDSARYES